MSWDVYLARFPEALGSMDGVPDDADLPPLGGLSEVLDRLRRELPRVDLSDPEWGHLESDEWSIELNIGDEDPLDAVMLHVRGGGDVIPAILHIAEVLHCRALDISTGEFLAVGRSNGWQAFQNYRDRVLGTPSGRDEEDPD